MLGKITIDDVLLIIKKTPNDQDLGKNIRKMFSDNEIVVDDWIKEELEKAKLKINKINESEITETGMVVREAMKMVAKDVAAPKVVREGKIKVVKSKK